MNTNGTSDRDRLVRALDEVWTAESSDVKRWGLAFHRDKIAPMYGGWVVPVATGVQGGNAYDLVRSIGHLQELVEQRSSLSISLMLDPFASSNGSNNH